MLLVLSLGLFMTLLDLTIVNVAIPRIVDGVHASLDQVLWMLNAYSLTYAVLLITSGRIGDIIGPRTMFMLGLVLFTAASAFSGVSSTPEMLIAGRALQGVGAAMLAPQSLPILLTLFPVEKRAPVFAVYGIIAGIAVVVGPTLGGFLVSNYGWQWIFYINLPVGAAVLLATLRLVPDIRPGRSHRLDFIGVALISAALFCLVFGLIEGQRYNWGSINGFLSIPLILGVGIALLVIFAINQARRQQHEPLLSFAVFRDRNFTIMTLVLSAMGFAIVGIYLPLTIYLQSVLGLSAIAAGLVIAVQPGAMFFASGGANGAGAKADPKYLLVPGLFLLAAGSAWIAWVVTATGSRWSLVPGLVVGGVGMGLIWGPVYNIATRDLAPSLAGVASGVLNTIQELGAVIASASVGALLQNRLAISLHDEAVQAATQLPPQFAQRFVAGFSNAAAGGFEVGAGQTGGNFSLPPGTPPDVAQHVAALAHSVFANGFVDAMRPTLILPIAVIVAAGIVAMAVRPRRASPAVATAGEAEIALTAGEPA
ncbi:MAG TPA: DHA2 family efflux MFS transporter permease subunit [Candidatus Dormibacteraeota bacterium]